MSTENIKDLSEKVDNLENKYKFRLVYKVALFIILLLLLVVLIGDITTKYI